MVYKNSVTRAVWMEDSQVVAAIAIHPAAAPRISDAMMNVTRQLIRDLGQLLELPALELDETNACQLCFDDVLVCLEVDEFLGRIVVYAPVGDLPVGNREGMLTMMLRANLFWGDTGGATLAVSRDTDKAVLQDAISLERLNVQGLADRLADFLDKCEVWTGKLLAPEPGDTKPCGKLLKIQAFI